MCIMNEISGGLNHSGLFGAFTKSQLATVNMCK